MSVGAAVPLESYLRITVFADHSKIMLVKVTAEPVSGVNA
jgi:hypothetical protein